MRSSDRLPFAARGFGGTAHSGPWAAEMPGWRDVRFRKLLVRTGAECVASICPVIFPVAGICSLCFSSLVTEGMAFYNPSNIASEAVVSLSSPPRADNRNELIGCLSASMCLNIDSHIGFSQEH